MRLVLASEAMQAELNARVEALAALRLGGLGPGDEDSDAEGAAPALPAPVALLRGGSTAAAGSGQATPATSMQLGGGGSAAADRAGSEAPAGGDLAAAQSGEGPGAAATAADWDAWLQQRRLGLRRPLGCDLHGRRYW